MAKKIIGTIPVARGEYNASANYYKENIVTMYGMSFRCVKNAINKAPATLASGKVTLTNTDVWQLVCGSTDIYNVTTQVQNNTISIAETPTLTLRKLYVDAGAEYNASGTDITKTAPWGETVTHKAGYYYLNGLGDITEEQMNRIYVDTYSTFIAANLMSAFRIQIGGEFKIRTNLRKKTVYPIRYTDELGACCYTNTTIEVFVVSHYPAFLEKPMNLEYAFYRCRNLKFIVGDMVVDKINAQTFVECGNLREIKLKQLAKSITLNDCPLISKVSISYIIENAAPTSAITITLHPDAYARLAEDADIVAALAAQPLVTLVSA